MSQTQEFISCIITVPNKQVDFFHNSGSQNVLSQDLFTLLNIIEDSKEFCLHVLYLSILIDLKIKTEQIRNMYQFILK